MLREEMQDGTPVSKKAACLIMTKIALKLGEASTVSALVPLIKGTIFNAKTLNECKVSLALSIVGVGVCHLL